jgi:outer membrane protein insertion porin family
MRHLRASCFSLSVLAFGLNTQSPEAQRPNQETKTQYFIERIELCCPRRVQAPTVQSFILSRTGAPYSDEVVQRDVQALRDSGFFFDVKAHVLDSPDNQNGKIVAFSLREKPIVRRIVYKGIKSIPESDIASAFGKEKVGLSVGTWFAQNELAHGAAVIKELLAAHGCPSATVKPTSETNFSANVVTVQFEVNEGPKSSGSVIEPDPY